MPTTHDKICKKNLQFFVMLFLRTDAWLLWMLIATHVIYLMIPPLIVNFGTHPIFGTQTVYYLNDEKLVTKTWRHAVRHHKRSLTVGETD